MLLQTTLLDVYAKVGNLGFAQKVFDEMPKRDLACWNALVAGLAQGSRPGEALALFWRMTEDEGLKPNEVTVLGALSACSQLGALTGGERVHGYIVDVKLDTHVIVCNAVIDMYAKCGSVDRAYRVFESMNCGKNLITWNTMIMAFAIHGDCEKALEIFQKMGRGLMQCRILLCCVRAIMEDLWIMALSCLIQWRAVGWCRMLSIMGLWLIYWDELGDFKRLMRL